MTPYLTAPIPGTGGTGVLMGEFDDDGRESLVLGFANNQWLTHFKVLGHGVVSWLTRGVSLGIYRNGFSIHSDDLFLPDARWSIAGHDRRGLRPGHLSADAGVQDPDEPADVAYLVAWQRRTGLKIDQAFNGFGSGDWSAQTGAPDPLLPAITAAKGSPRFINPNLGPARTATGVKWPGADASRETVVRRVGSARTVPRHPMNSFDNVGTKADEVAEYNWIDTSRDDGGSGYCADHPATETCISPLDPVSGYDAYIVPIEKRIAFSHIVANDPMPHSAHQANLAEDRILYPVLDSILATYRRTFAASALLVNPRLTNAGAALARLQDRRATTGVTARLGGRTVTVTNGSAARTSVPVTAPAGATAPGLTGRYAGSTSGGVALDPGATVRGTLTGDTAYGNPGGARSVMRPAIWVPAQHTTWNVNYAAPID